MVADTSDNQIAVMLNSGGGVFAAATPIAATAPAIVSVGDVDRDGHLDLEFSQSGANAGLEVALGNGDGTFRAPTSAPAGAVDAYKITADLSADGFPDLVSAAGNTISILLSNGDGTFRHGPDLSASPAVSVMTGDFDGDGNLDVVSLAANGTVDFFAGNGDGTFQADAPLHPTIAGIPAAALSGDFNHDGKVDLVFNETNSSLAAGGGIAVLLNQGIAPLPPHRPLPRP